MYKIVINKSASPTDFLASLTFFTVKNLTITCGKPAVPTIKARVIQKISATDFVPDVYSVNPKSLDKESNFCSK